MQSKTDAGKETGYNPTRVRQGLITGHVRYILGISLSLSIVALILAYVFS
jgi:hypothetical protein